MTLYLDLKKATQIPATGRDQVDEDVAIDSYDNSFKRRHAGEGQGDSLNREDPTDEKAKKSSEAVEILKSFNAVLVREIQQSQPNDTEVEYLLEKGFTEEDITCGRARIVGPERGRFNQWLHNRLTKSISKLGRR
jgi:hypothetical protein